MNHRNDGRLIFYDVTEGSGVIAWETSGRTTTIPIGHLIKAVNAGSKVVFLGVDHGYVLNVQSNTLRKFAFPQADIVQWTTAAATPGVLVLGGYDRKTLAYTLAAFDETTLQPRWRTSYALQEVFPSESIQRAEEDDDCGNDLFHVARILPWDERTWLLGLGGHGEGLGACQGAAALAFVQPTTHTWKSEVIDTNDGLSGLVLAGNDRALADTGGTIRLLRKTAD